VNAKRRHEKVLNEVKICLRKTWMQELRSIVTQQMVYHRSIQKVYCLGDLVGYGPDPEAVIHRVKEEGIETLMGNYDDAVGYNKKSCGCSYAPGKETEVGDLSLRWSIEHTSDAAKNFLRRLPKRIEFKKEDVRFLLVHGSPLDELLEYITPDTPVRRLKEIARAVDADVIVSGHTYLPMVEWVQGKLFLNPGSVGRPKDGDPKASYLLMNIENGVTSWSFVKVPYDVKTTCEKIIQRGLPTELAVVLALGQSYDMGPSTRKITFEIN